MKPSFALNLSHDGLSLLRRAHGGWQVIGSVALDDENLSDKLAYLRKTAAALAGGQLASKLVIPNSEILYRKVVATGGTDAERSASVAAALEGSTPYAVDELVFDWVDAGNGFAYVAAVARDTLAEAENFATEHRFNPVSFVAIPEGGTFVGEPSFGATRLCLSILPEGETVESDPGPIVIVGDHDPDTAPEPQPVITEPSGGNGPDTAPTGEDTVSEKTDVGTFATTRSDMDGKLDGDRDIAPGLQNVTARFALYADKAHAAGRSAPTLGGAPAKAQITPMPVTSSDVAGDEVTPDTAQKTLTPNAVSHSGDSAQQPAAVSSPAKPVAAQADQQKPDTLKSVFEVQQPRSGAGRRTLTAVALGLGLLVMILLAMLLSSLIFDRPISSARLWSSFSDPQDTLLAEPLTLPQIVATLIDPPTRQSPTPQAPAAEDIANLGTVGQQVDEALFFSESELAESEPDLPPLGEISAQEAIVIESSTGVWVLAPVPPVNLEPELLDRFYVASIDPVIAGHDALALPEIADAGNDRHPEKFASPAPSGTVFDLDENGFVRATPEGALSPNGVRVVLGAPRVRPTMRPQNALQVGAPTVAARQVPTTRPTLRPPNLIEVYERARLGGRSRSELAKIRPRARPASPQQTNDNADQAATALAVLSSRLPTLRPAGFASTVAAARAATTKAREAAAKARAIQTAAVVAAPRVPSIPTTASVAREATIANAINLSRINLIGIYGSSGNRRALVRLKNGRYVKVQIGDRLDGGKVAAIDGLRLQYIKAGRMVTLEIAS